MKQESSDCGRMIHVKVYRDADALARQVASALAGVLAPEPGSSRRRAVMLSGGSTPLAAYKLLAAEPPAVDPDLRLFYSDDRHVPPDHPKSNFGTFRGVLAEAGLAPERTLRIQGEQPLAEAVQRFDADLAALLSQGTTIPLGLLGLGADGHTASLFTPAHIAAAAGRLAIGVDRPDGLQGVSATPDFLRRVDRIIFVVAGADKQPMTTRLIREPLTLAAGLAVRGHRQVELWVDPAAAPR